jgi:type II secretory pathway pseudopilin PulG
MIRQTGGRDARTARPGKDRKGEAGITLIELLIGMTIATLLSGMVLMGWFTLQDSYSTSVTSNKAREYARDGMSRMVREIRDARAGSSVMYAVSYATPTVIRLTTSFNDADAASDTASKMLDYTPRQVTFMYDPATTTVYRTIGTGSPQALVTNVVNAQIPSGASPSTPLFTYTYIDGATGMPVTTTSVPSDKLAGIQSVRIHLLVDLNPGHSPVHMDLVSTAQLRNMRKL